MASKCDDNITTVYQCSECDHCSQNLEEATLHAVREHGDDDQDELNDIDSTSESFLRNHRIKGDKDACSSDEEYSNGSFNGKGGVRKKDYWPEDAIKCLLQCVAEHYQNLQNGTVKKKTIWETIRESVQYKYPSVSSFKCEQKWRHLVGTHRKYATALRQDRGKPKIKKPPFFDEVAEIVNEDGDDGERSNAFKDGFMIDGLHSVFSGEDAQQFYANEDGLDNSSVLHRLLSAVERREKADEVFQRRMLDVEKEKLMCIQKFVDNKEKFNTRRLQLMKDWIGSQSSAKRAKYED